MPSPTTPDDFPANPLVVFVADLAGYAAAFRTPDGDMARFLDW